MGLAWLICPRCSVGRPHDKQCATPACAELLDTPSYQRDQLECSLHIAEDMLAEGNTEEDWIVIVPKLKAELESFDRKMVEQVGLEGPAATTARKFKQ